MLRLGLWRFLLVFLRSLLVLEKSSCLLSCEKVLLVLCLLVKAANLETVFCLMNLPYSEDSPVMHARCCVIQACPFDSCYSLLQLLLPIQKRLELLFCFGVG